MTAEPLLQIEGLDVTFEGRRRGFRRAEAVRAVRDVSLAIAPGETVGLVGESGSGKSTLGRAVLRLLRPTAGRIVFGGADVASMDDSAMLAYRRRVQAVFQDPFGSLNPTKTVAQTIAAPLRRHFELPASEIARRTDALLAQVGLDPYMKDRYPYEFSGGQRQRIAIARAVSLEPDLIVLDEAVSALDVSVQSQVINLLEELQREHGMAYLFIAHDLAVVRHISHRVAVMYRGRLVEVGDAERVCTDPIHPYTKLLLATAPEPDPRGREQRRADRARLSATPHPQTSPTSDGGCVFADRCPLVFDECTTRTPEWTPVDDGGAACHLVGTETLLHIRARTDTSATSTVDTTYAIEETDGR